MAFAPIAECFQKSDKWFCGVVTTDGAGSPRNGIYADYTDEDMKAIRIEEQKKAAHIGGYGAQILLGYSSKEVKDKNNDSVVNDYVEILKATKPQYVYIHNLADKHETHVATAVKAIAALRLLKLEEQPEKVYGCEVWRNLDWLNDDEKVYLDCSQRRLSNATFLESHACDTYTGLNYAMDLTPLIKDKTLNVSEYVCGYIDRFNENVKAMIGKLQ